MRGQNEQFFLGEYYPLSVQRNQSCHMPISQMYTFRNIEEYEPK